MLGKKTGVLFTISSVNFELKQGIEYRALQLLRILCLSLSRVFPPSSLPPPSLPLSLLPPPLSLSPSSLSLSVSLSLALSSLSLSLSLSLAEPFK